MNSLYCDRVLSGGKVEEAKRRFEALAERVGTLWIGRAANAHLKEIASG